jgi:phosphorylcholine metabolism protein LicD
MKPFVAHRLTGGKKEIIQHRRIGHYRLNYENAKECLLLVKKIFDKHDVKFWLIYGTLLGAIREGDLIPWDRDLDIGVFESEAEKRWPAILELLDSGFQVLRTAGVGNSVQFIRGREQVDMSSYERYKYRGRDLWRWGRFFEPNDYFTGFREVPFLGTTFLVPEKAEKFLYDHYHGEAWKTPNPKCKHGKLWRCR